VTDEYPPTEKLSGTVTGSVAAAPRRPGRGVLITLITVGAVLLIAVTVAVTLLLTSGRPNGGGTIPSPSFSDSPSASATPSATPTPTPEAPMAEPDEEDPEPPSGPSGTIDSIVVSVFDGDGGTPEESCAYPAWEYAESSFHGDDFVLAVDWSSNGSIDRVDVVTSDGGSWPSKGADDTQFIPFECWNGPSQARQIQVTLTAFAAGTPIDTAIVIFNADQPVQISY
jgi:hypothetical protein